MSKKKKKDKYSSTNKTDIVPSGDISENSRIEDDISVDETLAEASADSDNAKETGMTDKPDTENSPDEPQQHNHFPTLHDGEKSSHEKTHIFDYEAESAKLMEKEQAEKDSGADKHDESPAEAEYSADKTAKKDKKSKKAKKHDAEPEVFEEHKITESEEKSLRERFKFDWELEEHILEALDEDAAELTDPDEESEPEPIQGRTISFSQAVQAVLGLLTLIFAVIGIVATGIKISQVVEASKDTSEQERHFEEFIMPLVACDAPTFDGAGSLNEDVIITAACWDIIFNPSVYYEYTGGVYSVSYLDIDRRIAKLFGPGLTYTHKTVGDTELSFEYDEETGMYQIPAFPRSPAYYPEITGMAQADNGTELTVCYRLPVTNWIPSIDTVEKTMIYTVVPTDTDYNVTAIRIGEIGESEAQ